MSYTVNSVNPATGAPIGQYNLTPETQINASLNAAEAAFQKWKNLSIQERANHLHNIAAKLRERKEMLAQLATAEMGKPIKQGREEVEKCAATLEYYAVNGPAMLQNEVVATEATKSYVTFRPLGVILAIMPWNFPYWQVLRAFAPIVLSGNVMVLKHASNVTGCALAIEEVIRDAGAPSDIFHTLVVPSSGVEALIAHRAIAGVTLTGSTQAGRSVAAIAGSHLKKQVLELGGSDAYIIMEDADIEAAAEICVNGRLKNSGQSCVAAKRFIVPRSIAASFEEAMARGMNAASWGDPLDENNTVGPMARADLRDQLHQQVVQSIAQGARLLCGGYIPDQPGAYYPPTVLTDVQRGMPAWNEELFGPVAAIIQVDNLEEAIAVANESEYGLGAAIIGKDLAVAEQIAAEQLEAGNCFVNDFVHSDARLPFGGVKNSGYGREIGTFGIKEFVNIKTVYVK